MAWSELLEPLQSLYNQCEKSLPNRLVTSEDGTVAVEALGLQCGDSDQTFLASSSLRKLLLQWASRKKKSTISVPVLRAFGTHNPWSTRNNRKPRLSSGRYRCALLFIDVVALVLQTLLLLFSIPVLSVVSWWPSMPWYLVHVI